MREMMKAAVLHAPGDLRVEQAARPVIARESKEVMVRVKAAGICGSDLERVMKTGTYHFPTIVGHEFCGVVAETGEQVTDFKAGDRVLVSPILPCKECDSCKQGYYGQCNDYNYLGSRTDGGFAEYVKAPQENLILLPDEVSFLEGAAVEPAAVTLHGIMRLQFRPGDLAVVLGCGAIGLFAIQFAKIMGASTIIAVDIEDEKLQFAKKAGATILINSTAGNAVEEIKRFSLGKGADVVIETAGTCATQVQSLEICKKHGQVLYLGTAHKDVVIPPKAFEAIIRNELTITGSWNSYSAPFPGREWTAVLGFLKDKKLQIKPFITHEFPLDKAPEVIRQMSERKFIFNKVVLVI